MGRGGGGTATEYGGVGWGVKVWRPCSLAVKAGTCDVLWDSGVVEVEGRFSSQ